MKVERSDRGRGGRGDGDRGYDRDDRRYENDRDHRFKCMLGLLGGGTGPLLSPFSQLSEAGSLPLSFSLSERKNLVIE